ncbi:MAG: hypothetical protein KF878_07675 [Planctomycetes bacterium]|nr:hypothetical protein [Planctomycetota bacterium]
MLTIGKRRATAVVDGARRRRPAAGGLAPRPAAVPSWWWALLIPPTIACATSWAVGGEPVLTDLGFFLLAVACGVIAVRELASLARTGRVAGLVLFGGVLLWFCHDYFARWAGRDFRYERGFDADLIARVATMHCLFVLVMTAGLGLGGSDRLERLLLAVREPRRREHYLTAVLLAFAIGLVPYVFFSRDSLVVTFERAVTGFYSGGVSFTFGRTGNLNFAWSGYLFELIKVGRFGGVLAGAYAVMIARTRLQRAIGWGIWTFWLLLAFGSGTRGQLVFVAMPVLVLLLLRHSTGAAHLARRLRGRALLSTAALATIIFVMMQVQGQLRTRGLRSDDISSVKLDDLHGNHMFSEGLPGWDRIPSSRQPFFDETPGEGALRALPEALFRVAVHPIPRALWTSKPIDPVWAWYNELVAGTTGASGTTISTGIVGWWYFRFGLLGMLQGALFMGWLLAAGDRALARARAQRRPLAMLVCLAFIAWWFRCFRDLAIGELYEVVVAVVVLALGVRIAGWRAR